MQWFVGMSSPEEIKKRYRGLAMLHHPDRGGSNDIMAEINQQYHGALAACDGYRTWDAEGHEHEYHYDSDIEQAVVDKIADLLRLRMADVQIWLVGTWIWIHGDTKQYKEALKSANCIWHPKRVCWYWKPYSRRSRYNSHADFAGLAAKYGFQKFEKQEDTTVAGR